MVPRQRPAIVMTSAYYGGTLAATRCLGERGIPVILADSMRIAPALWSRYVTRRELSPPGRPIERFIDWLLAFGQREPGNVLYATSDDGAWAFAQHAHRLSRCFRLLTPPFATVARLLDKRKLYEACADVGLQTPWTFFPDDEVELRNAAERAPYPVIVKPRTQVLFSLRKGVVAASAQDLRASYADFLRSERHQPGLVGHDADIERPMIQEFCGGQAMYCISGFCDPARDLFLTRAARKLVQWSREAGLGICFENAPVDPDLAAGVRRLCELTGHFGVFEAEFVMRGAEPLLVDFNPRFFGQMGFDSARDLPSAYLVYLAALGDRERLSEEADRAARWRAPGRMLFVDRTALLVSSLAERFVGRSASSMRLPENGGTNSTWVVDFTADERDWVPGFLDRTLQLERAVRHAGKVLRTAARGT